MKTEHTVLAVTITYIILATIFNLFYYPNLDRLWLYISDAIGVILIIYTIRTYVRERE